MALEKHLSELQGMISKFLAIHANPYDTSKHNDTAAKLEKLQTVLSQTKISEVTNDKTLGMSGEQMEKPTKGGMGESMEMPDSDDDFDGKPTPEEVLAHITTESEKITTALKSIKDLQELDTLETVTYGRLQNYYNSYSSLLGKEDKLLCEGNLKICKNAIDRLRLELQTNPDDNDAFIKEIETGIETINGNIAAATTLEAGKALLDEFNDLNDKFIIHTENAKTLSAAWVKEMKSKLDRLRDNIGEKQTKLNETVSELSNRCETVTWIWTIKEYKSDVVSKEDRIKRKIKKIVETLKISYKFEPEDFDNTEDLKGREKRLIKKLEKLQIKEAVLEDDNSAVTDTEEIKVDVVFCEKFITPRNSDKGKSPYWGISQIILPENKVTDNDAGLSISAKSTIAANGFSESANVEFTLVRGKARQFKINFEKLFSAIAKVILGATATTVNWGEIIADLLKEASDIVEEDEVVSKDSVINWGINISTDPEALSNVTLALNPENDHKVLDELSYKKIATVGTWVTYEGDMDKANQKFIEAAKKQLKIQ